MGPRPTDGRVPAARRWGRTAAAAVVPLCLLVAASVGHGPFYAGWIDPAYAYLLNALNLAQLAPPFHVDHPGTPVQVLGAAAIRTRWAWGCLTGTCVPVVDAVLTDPEAYLRAFHLVLNLVFAAALTAMGLSLARACGGMAPALAAQAGVAAFATLYRLGLMDLSAETTLAAVAMLLVAVLARPALGGDAPERDSVRRGLATGAVLGLGLAVKVTFLPLVGLVWLLRGARARWAALAAVPAAFLVATLPALPRYGYMFEWLTRLATHKGKYASGGPGLPGAAEVLHNLGILIRGEPILLALAVLFLAGAAALSGRDAADRGPRRTLWAVTAAIALQVALAAKYTFPHYMLPAMMAAALGNAALAKAAMIQATRGRVGPRLAARRAAAGLLVVVLLFGVGRTAVLGAHDRAVHRQRLANHAQVMARVTALKPCAMFEYYEASSVRYALRFGDDFAGRRYAERLAATHPGALFFNLWNRYFSTYNHIGDYRVVADHVARGGCAVLVGSRMNPERRAFVGEHVTLTPVIETPTEAAYRILGLR